MTHVAITTSQWPSPQESTQAQSAQIREQRHALQLAVKTKREALKAARQSYAA